MCSCQTLRTCETPGCGKIIEAGIGYLEQSHQDFYLDAVVFACVCGLTRFEPLKPEGHKCSERNTNG